LVALFIPDNCDELAVMMLLRQERSKTDKVIGELFSGSALVQSSGTPPFSKIAAFGSIEVFSSPRKQSTAQETVLTVIPNENHHDKIQGM
jgi:hypothetical protein